MSQALPPPGKRSSVSNAVDAASAGSKLSTMRSAMARARRSSVTRRILWAALLGGRPSSMAQTHPSKTKQIQIKMLGFAWICLVLFVRIGTFQWVTAEKIEIFFWLSRLGLSASARNVSSAFSLSWPAPGGAASIPMMGIYVTRDSAFGKKMFVFFVRVPEAGPGRPAANSERRGSSEPPQAHRPFPLTHP